MVWPIQGISPRDWVAAVRVKARKLPIPIALHDSADLLIAANAGRRYVRLSGEFPNILPFDVAVANVAWSRRRSKRPFC